MFLLQSYVLLKTVILISRLAACIRVAFVL